MQNVSQAWKDNQNNLLVSESDIEISLRLTDPDAYEEATATDNGHVNFSNTNHIVSDGEKNIRPYATLERNLWILDGSREILPANNFGETGFIDDTVGTASGTYSANPIISIGFSRVHTNVLQGLTITWCRFLNEYATDFIVTAYNGTTVVAKKTIADNTSVKVSVILDIVNYDRIDIEVTKWSMPFRRVRLDEVFTGVDIVFSKKDIFSHSCSHSADPISAKLPKSETSFSLNNVDNVFNPYNTEGISKYLIERQEISVKYGYKFDSGEEWISGGKFYLSEWDAKQGGIGADFKARDLLEFMTNTYNKGTYTPGGTSLYDLAEDVLLDADLPVSSDGSVKWVIDEGLKNIYTIAPLPIDTHANCLQMIANAGECVIYQDRKGILQIKQIINKSKDMIDLGQHTNIGWAVNITTPDRLEMLNQLTAGKYNVTITAQLKSKTSNFADGDLSRVVVMLSNGRFKEHMVTWYTTDVVGTTKTVTGEISFTEDELSLGITNIYVYGCGRGDFGATGTADISNISLDKLESDYNINLFNSYSKSQLSMAKPLRQVDVPCYSYSVSTEATELYKGTMNINGTHEILITYSGMATDVNTKLSSGTLVSATYYSNACLLKITATGNVTITVTGYTLESSSVLISTINGDTGETITVDNPLITSQDRANAIGKWVKDYMKNRMIISSSWRADPRLDALDLINTENEYGRNNMIMTSIKYSYNGAFRGTGEGRVV